MKTSSTSVTRMLFHFTTAVFLTIGVAVGGALFGCSSSHVLPGSLENRLTGDGTAEDHLTAAALYQHEAQRYENETLKYEQRAAAITPLEDPKGFRRAGLTQTAESLHKKAGDMNQLYAAHASKADTMMGMQPRQ
jgi:hypothetical protein